MIACIFEWMITSIVPLSHIPVAKLSGKFLNKRIRFRDIVRTGVLTFFALCLTFESLQTLFPSNCKHDQIVDMNNWDLIFFILGMLILGTIATIYGIITVLYIKKPGEGSRIEWYRDKKFTYSIVCFIIALSFNGTVYFFKI